MTVCLVIFLEIGIDVANGFLLVDNATCHHGSGVNQEPAISQGTL